MICIRQALLTDINEIAAIESQCFPVAEAASLPTFRARFAVFGECFFVIELNKKVVGHINGCVNDVPSLPDILYEKAELHQKNGKYQTVMGLAVSPSFQKQGLAKQLMRHFIEISQQRQHLGMILTCKKHLIGFYESFGFTCQGVSSSTHGDAQWHTMLMIY